MGCGISRPQDGPQVQPAYPISQGPGNSKPASEAADPISQGLGDAQQVVGLIDGIYQLVGPAILDAKNKKNEKDSLKRLIGPWWDQAFERGACRVPVLDIDRFETHLEKTNGVLTPRGSCKADSPWGYFLHALAINPEDNILTWKPATGAPWDMKDGALAMDVRGRAFCHLVNLYRIEAPTVEKITVGGNLQKRIQCHLSFGWLTWMDADADHVYATFEADTTPKLDGPKQPMHRIGALLKDRLWDSYKAAFEDAQAISDPEMAWPDPQKTPLSVRLECLIANLEKVRLDSGGLILTRQWLSDASSIKRRAMTNGSKDDSFLKDTYKILAQHPLRSTIADWRHQYLQTGLQRSFFFSNDRFIIQDDDRRVPSKPDCPISEEEMLNLTLESYNSEDPTSWKGQLYAARGFVLRVALLDRIVKCEPGCVRVLDFEEGDPLWKARVHL